MKGCYSNDSIRFFHVDRNWLDALVDGALSVGIIDSRGALPQLMLKIGKSYHPGKLMTQLNEREITADSYRRSAAAYTKAKGVDFEQMRSMNDGDRFTAIGQIFSGIRYEMGGANRIFIAFLDCKRLSTIEITAYFAPQFVDDDSEEAYHDDYLLDTLRQVRLSEIIMLCLFNGIPSHLRIKEPSEGIRLGVDTGSMALMIKPHISIYS